MTRQEWFEGLTEKEIKKLNEVLDNYRFTNTPEEIEVKWNVLLDRKYNEYLVNIKKEQEKVESDENLEQELNKQNAMDLQRGIATIELYESNKYRCWVAEVTGTDSKYGLKRNFINPVEIKGNYKIYELKEGKLYHYLNDNKEHFVKVINSKLAEITKSEIEEMVK